MSIIIHFNTASFIPQKATLPATSCISRSKAKSAMVPGIDQTDTTVMTDDESSMVDIATSNTLFTHSVNELKSSNHVLGSCFGLPYQDHNYGAPPPPTPPSYSPCASPAHANGVPDEDTNLSVVSTSTANEETQEGSITRCICGFEHDDEYMICCDLCLVWQHVDCMGLDRNNIPETYLCEKCEPRKVDRHKAKVLQTRKKVAMTDSSDSEDDTIRNAERKQKTRKKKRKEDEKNDDNKLDQGSHKRNKMHKHAKDKMEVKRSKLRRTKNKESTSTADEEAQDAWEISLEWCEKNFEPALNNQYTPEVQHLSKALPPMGHEEKILELLLTRNCKVLDGNQKKLVSVYDIPRDQPLIEFKGKFLLASQFHDLHPAFSRRLFPYVMFYNFNHEELCIDASLYGNEARFVRRSCKPNAELHHLIFKGNLHLYLSSTKAVFKDDEITLPHDFCLKESIKEIECACESEDCILKFHQKNGISDLSQEKRKKVRKLTFSADDDSSQSFAGNNTSPLKTKPPVKSASESTEGKSDHETEEQANERKKKTREERKIDAIMRAFDQMEKAAKRRQQALERQKAHLPKSEDVSERSENAGSSKEEDKVTTASGSETQGGEEEKLPTPTPKPKKGKRRRGSGTSGRRRNRTNSGGSDILSPEENMLLKTVLSIKTEVDTITETIPEAVNVTTSCTAPVLSPVASNASSSPVVLKTKRSLLHDWLLEKSENNSNFPSTPPAAVRTEVKWNTPAANSTCYVQCTKDNPHSGGISAAHLRRSSTSSQIKSVPLKSCTEQGFTKKRWLRQAMYDCSTCEPLTIDAVNIEAMQIDNGDLSPPGHGEIGSPGAVDDTITPLKKRRLMRESVESSSPLSPTLQSSEYLSVGALNSTDCNLKTETTEENVEQGSLSGECDSLSSNLTSNVKDGCTITNGVNDELAGCSDDPRKCEPDSDETALSNPEVSVKTSASPIVSGVNKEKPVKNSCDLNKETFIPVERECVQDNNCDQTQNICETKDSEASSLEKSSDEICSGEKIQSNMQTDKNSSSEKSVNDTLSSTNQCRNTEKKIPSSDDCDIQSSNFPEGNCSSPVESEISGLKAPMLQSNTKDNLSETGTDHCVSETEKLPEDSVHNVLNHDSPAPVANCESTKNNSADSVLQCSESHSPVPSLKSINVSITAPLEAKIEHSDGAHTPKKVSLSEYRMRMKDCPNKRPGTESVKRCLSSPSLSATAIPETLPEQVTLAPLPLFDTATGSKSPPLTSLKSPKKKKEISKGNEETYRDVTEYRENLTERLKREFGFDDNPEDPVTSSQAKPTCVNSSILPMVAQPPPPPPPPPPRPIRSSQSSLSAGTAATSSQFGFNLPTTYARPSYIIPQVPSAQFIPVQQTVNPPVLPSVHPITTPGVQPALLPSPHSFAPSLAGTVLRQPIQHDYSSVNAQNFAALVQQPPPLPPKTFPHLYRPGLYK